MKLETSETKIESIRLTSSYNGQPLAAYLAVPEGKQPIGIFQITHGMAEYWLRYAKFADFLAKNGFIVCGHDHLGHGATSGDQYPDGFFAAKNSADYVVKDVIAVSEWIKNKYPHLPLILFGHSMGSFFARWAYELKPELYDAAVFCGTGGENKLAGPGLMLIRTIQAFKGPEYCSAFVDKMCFGNYLNRISSPKTSFDWLSVNEDNVAAYIKDPKCGFLFSISAFEALVSTTQYVNTGKWYSNIVKDKPLLVIAGQDDPVGEWGKGPSEVAEKLKQAGAEKVTLKLFPEMRHEILNEKDNSEVMEYICQWCTSALQ